MVIQRGKVNFDKIWELIQEFDNTLGLFLFRDSPKKKTKKDKFFSLTLPTHVFLVVVLILSTLVVTNFALINVIFCGLIFIMNFGAYIILLKMVCNKSELRNLFDWCRSSYDVETKFHPVVRRTIESHLFTVEKHTLKALKWQRILFYVDGFITTIGYAIIGQFLPDSMIPKFSVPLPFYLPFKQQQTWIAFITTITVQFIFCTYSATMCLFIFETFTCIIIHILGILDAIQEIINKMKVDLLSTLKRVNDEEKNDLPAARLQMTVLAEINRNMTDKTNQVPFTEWMQILNDMISDVNSITSSLAQLYTEIFLVVELFGLSVLLFSGLIFTVVKQQHFFAIGMNLLSVVLFIICHINEKILEKFEGIKEALYDIPWYDLDVKQQKMLMILMNCDEIQKGFTATGIHGLTMERFGIILKAGYSNVLVLRDLVQK